MRARFPFFFPLLVLWGYTFGAWQAILNSNSDSRTQHGTAHFFFTTVAAAEAFSSRHAVRGVAVSRRWRLGAWIGVDRRPGRPDWECLHIRGNKTCSSWSWDMKFFAKLISFQNPDRHFENLS